MKLIFLSFSLLFLIQACQSQVKPDKTELIKLNNKAMYILAQSAKNKDSVLKAIQFIEEAIKKDSLYYASYSNKAMLLCNLGNYTDALENLDRAISLNPKLQELKELKGFMLEKIGKFNDSKEIFQNAIKYYDGKIKSDSANVKFQINRAFLLFFLHNPNIAIQEFNKIKERHPNNILVKNMEQTFVSFNKERFLNSMCIN